MIFARRALQRRLDELRATLGHPAMDSLVKRLNLRGGDRVAAMWEVVVLHGLVSQGALQHEVPLPSGSRPDIVLEVEDLRIVADITAVSDEGLDDSNPYQELSELIEAAKTRLGLPIGGMKLQIESMRRRTRRGERVVLKLPPKGRLQTFVETQFVPQLREQIATGVAPLRIRIDDEDVGLQITIDPTGSPVSSMSFAAYDLPRIRDQNPLYNALKAKAGQLRGAQGLVGIIVGDGDCAALAYQRLTQDGVSALQIVQEFFRQYSSVDFVLILSVHEEPRAGWTLQPAQRKNWPRLFVRSGCAYGAELEALFNRMLQDFPKPVMMPVNGALRAREAGYIADHHGGYRLGGDKICLSLRELTEVLAGVRTFADGGATNVEAARTRPQPATTVQSAFLRRLMQWRLPTTIKIIKGSEDEADDQVKIDFGDPDPAVTPFR